MATTREIKTLSLQRVEPNKPWGFRIVGGTDEALILKVDKVCAYVVCILCLKIHYATLVTLMKIFCHN